MVLVISTNSKNVVVPLKTYWGKPFYGFRGIESVDILLHLQKEIIDDCSFFLIDYSFPDFFNAIKFCKDHFKKPIVIISLEKDAPAVARTLKGNFLSVDKVVSYKEINKEVDLVEDLWEII